MILGERRNRPRDCCGSADKPDELASLHGLPLLAEWSHLLELIGADAQSRCVTRLQTERLRSAKSYVSADDTSAAASLLRGSRLSRNRQLKKMLQEYSDN